VALARCILKTHVTFQQNREAKSAGKKVGGVFVLNDLLEHLGWSTIINVLELLLYPSNITVVI